MPYEEHRRRLDEAMTSGGRWPERSPWTRQAVRDLPRHEFTPDRLWDWTGEHYVAVDRTAAPQRWADLVYAGPSASAVTQVTDGRATSSLSCPAIVVDMLDSLMPEPGHQVLELGTGTGWNAALLAHRAGPGRVVSIELDTQLAATARRTLAAAGAEVMVETGDGAKGRPAAAPYDRVVSTYAVDEVPWAWVEQTRPGGRIVTPWGRLGHVALTVADDGASATGWMQGLATFMPSRGTDQGRSWHQVRGTGTPAEHPLYRDPRPLHEDRNLLFALRVALPDVQLITRADDGVTVWAHDGHSSWATLTAPDTGPITAYQGGPRRLDKEIEHAWQQWTKAGAPGLYDFGMTVTPHRQFVWSNDPTTGPQWTTVPAGN
ncbi:methyltransferase domain-containing protein [Streptomyces sp. NPDC050610]|uniref:methyltransferase domain-containing protein n=1 Tax=Streptomyces sp. NPDC050610 TaxID=3157097 RepID=UPI00341AFC51